MENTVGRRPKGAAMQHTCKICGAPAQYSYFGTISCRACKIFFKRNAEHGQETLQCLFDGHCEIDQNNRHVCSFCRLRKCFLSGMQIEKIRCALSKVNQKRNKTSIPMVTLMQSTQPILTDEQWNLLSDLSYCYDEHSQISICERYVSLQSTLPLKLRFKSASMIELFQTLMNGCRLLYTNNRDLYSLSFNDRSVLLHKTFKHVECISTNFILSRIGLTNYPAYYNTLETIIHPNVIPTAKLIANRCDFDTTVMKLFLAILSFSTINLTVYDTKTSTENLSDIKQVLHIQDTYIELTWRYLIYKYDAKRSILCFSDLIRCFFAVNNSVMQTYDIQWLTDAMNYVVNQTEDTIRYK
ncbi:unnamed protein product [Adineta ricciae]|uniref:Nuclear receptor domain-containing protein n=2 Tax=Adineta ricciae TaxID=249248 RepID=A0A815GWR5_ADIRI|nr:unnamed protein product [Adineta ricciae]